ncbi:Rv3235 family protein [Leifsonia sp. C5G2]|uniref:Rv3235 family protein n=1 Tax=Leifsonia sp. C5G2 TaxID=2735269 RepID=UPI0032DEC342
MATRAAGGRDAAALPRLAHPESGFDLARAATVRSLPPAALVPVPPIGTDGVAPPRPGPDLVDAVDPSPAVLCSALARCVVEILAGARSLDQVARWVSDAVYVHLLRRNMLAQRARQDASDSAPRPRVHIGDPKLSSPTKDVIEAVVMVHQPARSRAVAIRLERHRSRWRASAINVL